MRLQSHPKPGGIFHFVYFSFWRHQERSHSVFEAAREHHVMSAYTNTHMLFLFLFLTYIPNNCTSFHFTCFAGAFTSQSDTFKPLSPSISLIYTTSIMSVGYLTPRCVIKQDLVQIHVDLEEVVVGVWMIIVNFFYFYFCLYHLATCFWFILMAAQFNCQSRDSS